MDNKIRTTIYLMPGMAASPKIFELIKFPPQYKIIYLKYVAIAQLGERKTEDLKVTGSIPVCDNY